MVNHTILRVPRRRQILLIAGAIWAGVAAVAYQSDWTLPQWLEGDALEIYARVKLAREQPVDWLLNGDRIAALGAPGPADWSDYPVPDRLVFVLTGLMSRSIGLISAVQAMSCIILGLNAAAFFLCARWLRFRWEWAAGLAVVFAFCNYNIRWGITLSLGQTFLLPPLILLCAHAARRGAACGGLTGWLVPVGAMGAWLGLSNPYHAYFAGVVGGGALLLALFRRVGWPRLLPLVLFLGVLSLVFLVNHAPFILRQWQGGSAQGLTRSMGDMATYALKPMDWIMPPNDHRIPALSRLGLGYQAQHGSQGEFFYNYLGLLGLAALLGFCWQAIRRAARREWQRLDAAYGLVWLIAFGLVGGINYWLGLAGLDLFRASSRIGIYAHVWLYLSLCGWLSCHSRIVPRLLSVLLAIGLSFAACWESTLPIASRNYPANHATRWSAYAQLTEQLENALPPNGAVFQLPVLPFPEAGKNINLPDYEHFLPYLTSTRLRFSYGTMQHDPKLRWARYVSTLPPAEMIAALESAGFSALWIDERGYADSAQAILRQLQMAGRPQMPGPPGLPYLHVFPLHAASPARMPDLSDPRLLDNWDDRPGVLKTPRLLAADNWYQPESDAQASWRWAPREATLGIWHEGNTTAATLRFRLDAPVGSTVTIRRNDMEIWRGAPGPEPYALNLTLAAGLNSLVWRLEGPTFKPRGADPRELGFMVENLSVSVP